MDIFNLNLPPGENENDKFPKLDAWFDFINDQMQKLEKSNHNSKLNSILEDNNINTI